MCSGARAWSRQLCVLAGWALFPTRFAARRGPILVLELQVPARGLLLSVHSLPN
jgi:hypothetical protein